MSEASEQITTEAQKELLDRVEALAADLTDGVRAIIVILDETATDGVEADQHRNSARWVADRMRDQADALLRLVTDRHDPPRSAAREAAA